MQSRGNDIPAKNFLQKTRLGVNIDQKTHTYRMAAFANAYIEPMLYGLLIRQDNLFAIYEEIYLFFI